MVEANPDKQPRLEAIAARLGPRVRLGMALLGPEAALGGALLRDGGGLLGAAREHGLRSEGARPGDDDPRRGERWRRPHSKARCC